MPKPLSLLIVLTALLLAGCATGPTTPGPTTGGGNTDTPSTPAEPPRSATLFIAGGGRILDGPLASAFLGYVHADGDGPGRVLVLPTASGVPVESGQGAAAALRAVATRHTVGVVALHADDPAMADDPLIAELVRHADGLWFTGGDQSRITNVFRPATAPGNQRTAIPATPVGPALVDRALRDRLSGGGTVGGTSAGAAMMSDPMIAGGRSEQALLVGVAGGGVEVAQGMGLFPYGLIDQHFLERGRLGRLIVALEHTGQRWGMGIEEGAAVVVTLGEAPLLTALGPDSALLVDMADATRDERGNRAGVRLSLLGTGDTWDPATGGVTPEPERRPRDASQPVTLAEIVLPEADAWAPEAVRDALHALAAYPNHPQVLHSRAFTLTFTADDRTGFYLRPDDRRDLCAIGVRLDIARR